MIIFMVRKKFNCSQIYSYLTKNIFLNDVKMVIAKILLFIITFETLITYNTYKIFKVIKLFLFIYIFRNLFSRKKWIINHQSLYKVT